ncbi:MAG: DapH/DapD/GlmU-related protein [Nitrosotalea sp.]
MNHQSEFNIKSMLSSQNIDFETEGDTKRKIKNISPITNAKPSDLSFCHYDGDKAIDLISKSKAGVILCKKSLRGLVHPRQGAQFIFLDKPRYVFVNLANKIFVKQKMIGIAPSAVISQTARIGDRCYIGEYTVIGDNCKIGNDTIIYDKVTLVKDCSIGNRCIIHSGIILGDDGFAFERDEENLYKFPHFGRVLIGDDVEICANSHIAKGSLSDTIINNGAKIDSLVHISHNVSVGKNCEITAGAIVGGSVKIGNSTWIGLNATIKDQIKIGNNVIVASGASVIHDVSDHDIVAGVPAKSIKNKINEVSDKLFLMAGQRSDRKE